MINIDDEHYKWLINNCKSGEGNLLLRTTDEIKTHQLNFLITYLNKINPKKILEIGTNCCCFAYLVKQILPSTKIITIGIDHWSDKFVNYFNNVYGNYIEFIHGDSRSVMDNVNDNDIDLVWIDGCHHKDCVTSDINQCKRLKIPHIFIDDYEYGPVKAGVQEFLVHNKDYVFSDSISNTFKNIPRDIAYIKINN
jgi:hypothetical protein